MAFDQIEPFGSMADDYRSALICRTIADAFLKRQDGDRFTIEDFVFDWAGERTKPQKSPEELMASLDFYFSTSALAHEKGVPIG